MSCKKVPYKKRIRDNLVHKAGRRGRGLKQEHKCANKLFGVESSRRGK